MSVAPSDGMKLAEIVCTAWVSRSISVAARLGLADLLRDGPRSCNELAQSTRCHAPSILRLLRLLSSVGIFQPVDDDRFANSPISEFLGTDHVQSVRHFCILAGEEYYDASGELLHTVKTGASAFSAALGSPVYEYLDKHPDTARIYDRAMEELCRPVADLLVRKIDFAGVSRIVDIAGGNGALARALLAHVEGLRCIVVERRDVCENAPRDVGGVGVRLRFEAGDFFSSLPTGGDIYVLKNVLHNWNERNCERILTTVHRAMVSDETVLRNPGLVMLEPLIDPTETSTKKHLNALFQFVVCETGTVIAQPARCARC
jgi:C-methyltransferase